MLTADLPVSSLFDVLNTVLLCSEKAATIARLIKVEHSAFSSLVQQKRGPEANARFTIDVKTLADVLIQEVVRFDMKNQFPDFDQSVFGEENSQFYNEVTNETIHIRMSDSVQEMSCLLFRIFGEGDSLACKLAEIVTQPLGQFRDCTALKQMGGPGMNHELEILKSTPAELSQYAVWIDPIDSTAEYVQCPVLSKAENDAPSSDDTGFHDQSSIIKKFFCSVLEIPGQLVNVTVLIGIFNRTTGNPILGVVNQPFYIPPVAGAPSVENAHVYAGRIFWGVNNLRPVFSINCTATSPKLGTCAKSLGALYQLPDQLLACAQSTCRRNVSQVDLRIACSSVEFSMLDSVFKDWPRLSQESSEVLLFSSPGAGFKLLCVIMDQVDAYLVLKPNTYWWDTCAPHAILRALGGGLIRLKRAIGVTRQLLSSETENIETVLGTQLDQFEVKYREKTHLDAKSDNPLYCNVDGFLAYRRKELATKILIHLARHMSD